METLNMNKGDIFNGQICGDDCTFKINDFRKDGSTVYAILECIEYGAPFTKIEVNTLLKSQYVNG